MKQVNQLIVMMQIKLRFLGLNLHSFKKNEKFHTLLDKTIDLNKSNLVFSNSNNETINLAGVVGSK